MVDTCSVVKYPEQWNVRREPKRPVELRRDYFNGMKFDENFDWSNLWYDAVQVTDDTVLLIGPPLYQSVQYIAENCMLTVDGKNGLAARYIEMDRAGMIVVQVPGRIRSLLLLSANSNTVIPVNQALDEFSGLHCMFTLQKDNPISWMREWILYHKHNLGVQAFIIYDNGSTKYNAAELEAKVSIPNVKIKIVQWNVPYGPQGFDCDHYNTWDSDYAQSSMFEHAKRRYLSTAKIAINADIDELVVLKDKTLDMVAEELAQKDLGGYCYKGNWIEPYDIVKGRTAADLSFEDRHFADFYCTDASQPQALGNKWMVAPDRALDAQWVVHHTGARMEQTTDIYYGHYLPMNTNWSWPRDKFDRDISGLVPDELLRENLSKIRNMS